MRDRRGEKSRDRRGRGRHRGLCGRRNRKGEVDALRRHVAGCQDCATYFDRMGAVEEALAGMQGVKAPDDFAAIVMQRLLTGLGPHQPSRAGEHGRGTLVWVAAAGSRGRGGRRAGCREVGARGGKPEKLAAAGSA